MKLVRTCLALLTVSLLSLTACTSHGHPIPLPANIDEMELGRYLQAHLALGASPTGKPLLPNSQNAQLVLNTFRHYLRARLDAVACNIANADTIADGSGKNVPYRRQLVVLRPDGAIDIQEDPAPPIAKYEPASRMADSRGMVLYPNIDLAHEQLDAVEISREYQQTLALLDQLD